MSQGNKKQAWLPLSAAAEEYGLPAYNLRVWAQKGCPWLNGKKLRSRQLRIRQRTLGEPLRRVLCVWRKDVETIRDGVAEGRPAGDRANVWCTPAEAKDVFGFSGWMLRRWAREK